MVTAVDVTGAEIRVVVVGVVMIATKEFSND